MTVDELLAMGSTNLATAQHACTRSTVLQHAVDWNIAWARVLCQRRPCFSGGSETAESDTAQVRRRLRELIDRQVLPEERPRVLWAGKSAGGHRCVACRRPLLRGEFEVEVTMAATVRVFLHRRCLELWPAEANDGQTPPATG